MNKRFYLKFAGLLCCLIISVQIVYGQYASNGPFHANYEVNSNGGKKSQPRPNTENNAIRSSPLADKLRAVLRSVKNGTNILVLVPNLMSQSNFERNACVNGGSNRDAYSITISDEPACGANAGMVASFTAERNARLPEKSEVDKVVSLAKGIEGFYTAKSCGASCSPPQIQFIYEKVLYTFQVKPTERGGERDEARMIEMINSALLSAEN